MQCRLHGSAARHFQCGLTSCTTSELRQNSFYDFSLLDPGQLHVQALISVAEPIVVNAELMQDRRLKVTDVNGVFDDVVAELVRFAMNDSAFDPTTCHPEAEATGM